MLQRIYGIAAASQEEVQRILAVIEEAKKMQGVGMVCRDLQYAIVERLGVVEITRSMEVGGEHESLWNREFPAPLVSRTTRAHRGWSFGPVARIIARAPIVCLRPSVGPRRIAIRLHRSAYLI